MPKSLVPIYLTIFLAKVLIWTVRFLAFVFPAERILNTFGLIARFYSKFRTKETQLCAAQVYAAKRMAPELCQHPFFSLSEKQIGEAVFEHVGRVIGEAMLIPLILRNPDKYIESVGDEVIEELLSKKEGAVCLSGHIGCFELLAAYQTYRGVSLSVIGRYPNIEWMGIAVEKIRRAYGIRIIWREAKSSGRILHNSLTSGEFLAALIDQDTKLENKFSPFFGIQASHPIMPIRLAIRTKRPILTSFIVRTGVLTHRVESHALDYDPESENAEQEILDEYAKRLNEIVSRYPDQWIWWHKRWRRRPDIDYNENPEKLKNSNEYRDWTKELKNGDDN